MAVNGHACNLFFNLHDARQENKMWVFSWGLGSMFQSWGVLMVVFLMFANVNLPCPMGKALMVGVGFTLGNLLLMNI